MDNTLQFNQYKKPDKIQYITYADLESLIKKQMDMLTTQKKLQQQKQGKMFLADIQRQLYGHSIILKICIVCIAEKVMRIL